MRAHQSYAQILKASSIMGAAAAIGLIFEMLRVKFAALLIGATGIGLNANFVALSSLIGTVVGLGIHSSAVRDVAAAFSTGNTQEVARVIFALRRLCWLTGLIGMALIIILSPLLSRFTFGHTEYVLDIGALGLFVMFNNISAGQLALLQGARRMRDIACATILSAALGTVTTVALYMVYGLRGIVPALVVAAAVRLVVTWYLARQVKMPATALSWVQTFSRASGMFRLGVVIMISEIMVNAVSYATVALITRYEGIQAVGLYSAAYALSGMFVNYVLGAMAVDYYPRLIGLVTDKAEINRAINEQTEVGILLALPGLAATLIFSPYLIRIFYAREFLGGVEALQWFVLGCLCRVISWPLGFLLIALGKNRWYLFTEISFNLIHVALIFFGLRIFKIEGVAMAFVAMYCSYSLVMCILCHKFTSFAWSEECRRLIIYSLLCLIILFVVGRHLPLSWIISVGLSVTLGAGILCLHRLLRRIGPHHPLNSALSKLPGVRLILF